MTTKLPLLACALLLLTPLNAASQDTVNAVLAGTGPGGGQIRTLNAADGTVLATATPFGPAFTGGVRVAAGDIDGDGTQDFIVGSGPGAGQVSVLDGEDLSVLWSFTPFGASYNGGVYVASGDIDGDSRADVIVGAGNGAGGGGQVRVYSGADHSLLAVRTPFGSGYHHGVTVAAGDITGDTRDDLVTGMANGGLVRVLDGVTGLTVMTIQPYGASHNQGVNVAAGDVNGDGRTDVITGPGGRVRQVKVFSGFDASLLASFEPYPTGANSGAYVAAGKVDGDTRADIITGPGNGQQPRVKIFSGLDLSEISSFLAFSASFQGGVFVAAVREDSTGPEFTSDDETTFHVGVFGTFEVTTSGSSTPTLTSSGPLPSGVDFTDNGDGTATLDGIPADGTGGVYVLTFTADDGVNPPVMQTFTLTVNETPEITSADSATFLVGSLGDFTVTTDGHPDAAIAIGGDALPGGVTFVSNGDGTGTLGGTPAAGSGGIYNLTFTPSNVEGTGATQNFTLTVEEAPVITSANSVNFKVGEFGTFTVTTNGFPDPTIARGGVALPNGVNFADNLDGTGTLSGTPQAGTGGSYAITFTATNSVGSSPTQNFTLTVEDAPVITSANSTTFTIGVNGTFTVTSTGFPTNTLTQGGDALPPNVGFADNGNNTGTLSGTPQPGTQGVYDLTFTAANGVPPNAVQSFTLTIQCATITVSPPNGTLPDGFYGVAYGPINFSQVGSSNPITWSATGLPAGLQIGASSGVLDGTPNDTVLNAAVVVTATDSFGCSGTSNQTLTVRPKADDDEYFGGVGHTQFVVGDAAPPTPFVFVADNVKNGDAGFGTLSVTFGPAANGTVAEGADGTFTYTPNLGFAGPSDSFSYTLTDGHGITNTATVTINLSNIVWYVNSQGPNGTGQSHAPFNTLANAEAPSLATHYIYVHKGLITTGNLAMDSSQTLHGQGATFTLNSLTIAGASGLAPTLTGTVALNANTLVRAVNFATSLIPALTGSALVNQPAAIDLVNTTGGTNSLSLTNVTGAVTVSNSSFSNASGAEVLMNGGNAAATIGAVISNNALGGQSVDIQNRTGGVVSFSGSITDLGTGILLNANTGSTIGFAGGLALSTGANPAFTATAGGTVTATQNNTTIVNTIATTTGVAVNVANTTIGAGGLTFRSITANGAPNGVVLANSGTGLFAVVGNGGTCTSAGTCSGGAVQNTTGDGVSLDNAHNVSITRMFFGNIADAVTNNANCDLDTATGCAAAVDILGNSSNVSLDRIVIDGDDGIDGAGGGNPAGQIGISGVGVNGLTLTNSTIKNVGESNDESGVLLIDPQGTVMFTDVTVTDPAEYGIRVYKSLNTTLNMTLLRVLVQHNIGTFGEQGFSIRADGGTSHVLVDDSDFLNTDGQGVDGQAINAATLHLTVQNSNFNENRALPSAINFVTDNTANGFVKIDNNTIVGCAILTDCSQGIDIDANRTSTLDAIVTNNDISGTGLGSGLEYILADGATGRAEIRDNVITLPPSEIGMTFLARNEGLGGTLGRLDVTLEGNTLNNISSTGGFTPGIQVLAGASGVGHTQTMCVNTAISNGAGNNSINGTDTPGLTPKFEVRQRTGTGFILEGFLGTGTIAASVAAHFDLNNSGTLGPTFVGTGGSNILNYTAGTCNVPTTPTLP